MQLVPADGRPEAAQDVGTHLSGSLPALGSGELAAHRALGAGVGQPGQHRFGFPSQRQEGGRGGGRRGGAGAGAGRTGAMCAGAPETAGLLNSHPAGGGGGGNAEEDGESPQPIASPLQRSTLKAELKGSRSVHCDKAVGLISSSSHADTRTVTFTSDKRWR